MSADLPEIYREALDLTFRQRMAIKESRWDDLMTLLEQRNQRLEVADRLLRENPARPDRTELHGLLEQIHDHDKTNQRILTTRYEDLRQQLDGIQHGRQALSAYLGALTSDRPQARLVDGSR